MISSKPPEILSFVAPASLSIETRDELPEQILLSKTQYEDLQSALEKARQAVLALSDVSAPEAEPPPIKKTPRPSVILRRVRNVTIYRLTREERLLEQKVCARVRDPGAYRIACRLLREGKAPQETAEKLSLPVGRMQEIKDRMLGPKRKKRDEAIAKTQLITLLDELVVERQEAPKPKMIFRKSASELSIERDQVLL